MNQYIVTGASSGLGRRIAALLNNHGQVYGVGGVDGLGEDLKDCVWFLDLELEDQMQAFAQYMETIDDGPADLRCLINCAGVNYIEWFNNIDWHEWDYLMAINAKAQAYMTLQLLPWLQCGIEPPTVCNIISNASHIPMTNSLCYNASKAAAEMVTRQMAHELGPKSGTNLTVFGVSPNKLAGTGMSRYIEQRVPTLRGWTEEYAREYQLKALPTGEETSPDDCAEFVAWLLSEKRRHKWLHGCIVPYGA